MFWMTLADSRAARTVLIVVGGALVIAGGLSSPASAAVAAVGGALAAGGARLFRLRTRPSQPSAPLADTSDRLDALTYALVEGVLDLYSLVEVGRTVNASLHFEQLMTTTLKRVAETTGIESYAFFVLDRGRDTLVVKSIGGAVAQSLQQMTVAPARGLADHVCRTRVAEMHSGPDLGSWPDVPRAARAVYAIPLAGQSGVLGALLLYSAQPAAFAKPEQTAYFNALGRQLSIAFDNATLHSRAMDLSYHDALTGFFNRRYLDDALENEVNRAKRYGLPLSVNMVDIDHFKEYNDTYGHARGDEILRVVADKIREQTRRADILIRYGGEEFVVILPLTSKAHARLVAEKLRGAVAATVTKAVGPRSTPEVTVSVGVATFPEDASGAPELLRAADAALYQAKERGRNRVEVFLVSGDGTS
jgi:diguanylate cyclase (GGDEF)-like protein